MPTTYPYAPNSGDAAELLKIAIEEYMPWINSVDARIDTLMAVNPDGPAVVLHGYACIATIKINNIKARALGQADALITIDHHLWEEMNRPRRLAVLHHEIYHLDAKDLGILTDEGGEKKWKCARDSLKRPRLGPGKGKKS